MKKFLWRMAWIVPVVIIAVILDNAYNMSTWAWLAVAAVNVIGWAEGKIEDDIL